MGEAKRTRAAIESGPCPCGSSKPGNRCCFDGKEWKKPPALLGLRALPPNVSVNKCYMKELGSCEGPISGEHLFSHSIMLLLQGDGNFSISGVPWLAQGEAKVVSPKALTAKCLCRRHNSSLEPLDSAGLYFFKTLKSYLEQQAQRTTSIVSGHDIERWLLKTIIALAVSKNLARGREPFSGGFVNDALLLDMLDDPLHWPEGAGLYCLMAVGEFAQSSNQFQIAPLIKKSDEIYGLVVSFLGLVFVLMLQSPDPALTPNLNDAKYRPGALSVRNGSSTNWIYISWVDGKRHEQGLEVTYMGKLKR